MMVFDYNVITGMSYRWVDTPGENLIDDTISKKQQMDNLLTSLRICTKSKAHI